MNCHAVLVLAIFKYETRMRVRAMNRRPRLEGVQKMFFSWKIGHKTSALVEAMLFIYFMKSLVGLVRPGDAPPTSYCNETNMNII